MKIKKILVLLSLFLAVISVFACFSSFQEVSANNSFQTSAKSMCVMEATTKRVLRAKNEHTKRPMASTTKIMTAITAIENCENLDETFVVSNKAIGISGTSLYLREGEEMSIRDLLYGLMLVSGNDAAVAIGEKVAGREEFFVDLMNNTAKKIGAKNTHYANPHGLDEKDHYTTAYDLSLISSYALQNPIFREIVGTKNTKITSKAGKVRYLKNKNKLLTTFDGAVGVKTGFTDDAGRCFVGGAERDGMTLVCSVLSCGPMFEDTASLMQECFNEYKMVDITNKVFKNRKISVENGKMKEISLEPSQRYFYPLRQDEEKKLSYQFYFPESLVAPIKKGENGGEIKIFFDNDLLFSLKFTTIDFVDTKGVFQRLFDILNRW